MNSTRSNETLPSSRIVEDSPSILSGAADFHAQGISYHIRRRNSSPFPRFLQEKRKKAENLINLECYVQYYAALIV